MPSVVQESVTYGGDLSHKDRSTEPNFVSGISGFTPKLIEPTVVPVVSGFTAVNGRSSTSPPSDPARANGSLDVRPSSEIRLSPINDQKRGFSVQHQGPWHYTTGDHSRRMTSPIQNGDKSASTSPITSKRKRDTSDESSGSSLSPVLEGTDEEGHRLKRLNGYSPIRGQSSPAMSTHGLPNTVSNPAAQPARSDYSPPTERKESVPLLRGPSESAPSDGRLSEVLQREGQDVNQARQVGEPRSGDEHMASSGHHLETFSGEGPRPLLQGDPKKRKRQFANRTKTGCQTCRRRKKKCDEGKPECANCRRGGFLCEGYLAKTPYKPSVARGPVQIQSKDGYGEQHPHPAHPQHLAQPHHQPQLYHRHGPPRDSSSIPDTNSQHADGARTRPIVVDDNERQTPRSTWPSWNDSSIRPYAQHPPPSTDYPPPPRTISQPYADHPAPAPLAQRPPPPAPYSHTSTSNPTIATAQLALQHQSTAVHAPPPPPPVSYSSSRQPQSEKSEKEKMLAGEHYKWRAPELVEEREQCKVHLWRFNNAAQNPTMGVSREERTRLFRTILEAPHVVRHNKDTPVGSVGKDVMVEAPFMCDYGYNINIGDGVVIGSGCTVMDPCKIMIGPRTVIGPNCNIYGLDMPKDPLVRQGGLEATAYGKDIVIEEDVFIGGNVTILPGVRIGRGATIGAGSIVTKDIAPHTVWACKQHGRLDQLQVLWNANR